MDKTITAKMSQKLQKEHERIIMLGSERLVSYYEDNSTTLHNGLFWSMMADCYGMKLPGIVNNGI